MDRLDQACVRALRCDVMRHQLPARLSVDPNRSQSQSHPRPNPTFERAVSCIHNTHSLARLNKQHERLADLCTRRRRRVRQCSFLRDRARSGRQAVHFLTWSSRPSVRPQERTPRHHHQLVCQPVRPSVPIRSARPLHYFPFRPAGLRPTTSHPASRARSIRPSVHSRSHPSTPSVSAACLYLPVCISISASCQVSPLSTRSPPRSQRFTGCSMIRISAKRARPHSFPNNCPTMMMAPSTPASAVLRPVLADFLVYQYVVTATSAILAHMLLAAAASSTDFGGVAPETVAFEQQEQQSVYTSSSSSSAHFVHALTTSAAASTSSRNIDSIHQTGTKYRSNNAGDGPEKTRDRKSWFPRFKSNWLGTYRSKQMFHCCECAVVDAASARYKGSEGKHCVCGQDQWHLAKTIEENEYNRRMEISKALGGLRYDEALERLKAMGTSEVDLKRLRCESDEASVTSSTSSSMDDPADAAHTNPHGPKRIKNEPLPSPATRAYGSHQRAKSAASFGLEPVTLPSSSTNAAAAGTGLTAEMLQKINQSYSSGSYTPLSGDYLGGPTSYDHLVPASFADEENFGELLQGFLEDDPRNSNGSGYQHYQQQTQQHQLHPGRPTAQHYSYNNTPSSSFLPGSTSSAHHQQQLRYPQAPSTLPPPPQGELDFEFFADGHHRGMAPAHQMSSSGYSSYPQHQHHQQNGGNAQYGRPHLTAHHHPHASNMTAPLASSTSFSIV